MSIFKDCDIRGVYGSELDANTALALGRAVGERMVGLDVVVGGDLRTSTPILKEALIAGLVEIGAHVVDVGLVPTPVFYFAKRELGRRGATGDPPVTGGVMVTASHNPAQYNGFKVMLGDLPISPEGLEALAQRMATGQYTRGQGTYRRDQLLPRYREWILQAFPALHARHVVVDAGNGSLSLLAPELLSALGQNVEELYCTPDGTFPNRHPNPAVASHLASLRRLVVDTGAELGIAYDGDGDRVAFVDSRGEVLPAERPLVLFVRHLLGQHPGAAVVYDQKCSSVVPEQVAKAGGRAIMERSGYGFIKGRLLSEDAVLGGEVSGHFFFGALGGDDAVYATLLLLKVLDGLGVPLAQASDSVPTYPITPDIRLACSTEHAAAILEQLAQAYADHRLSRLDGVRVQFPDGWALARISVTEPVITLRFEAHTTERLAAIQREVLAKAPLLNELMTGT